MKPILLKMYNVGPFRNESVDFTALDEMFLVSGKTGSGKSTIFDAMTYALYGELAGTRKKTSSSFRSDFCAPDDDAFVEFTFLIDNRTIRIHRTLSAVYINRNGKESIRAPEVSLEIKTKDGSWQPFTGKTTETNEKIEKDIIHLSASEFTRIVLLPQGAFADFLHAGSREKRDMLAKLFPVDFYSRIAAAAKEKADRFAEEERILEAQLTEGGLLNDEDADKTAAGNLDAEIKNLCDREKILSESVIETAGSLEKIKTAAAAAVRREELVQHAAMLESQRPEMERCEENLNRAAEAQKIEGYLRAAEDAHKHSQKAADSLLEAEKALQTAEAAVQEREGQAEEMQKLQDRTEKDTGLLEIYAAKKEQAEKYESAVQTADQAVHAAAAQKEILQNIERDTKELSDGIARLAAESGGKADDPDPLSFLLTKRHEAADKRAEAERQIKEAQLYEKQTAEYGRTKALLAEKKTEYENAAKLRDDTAACLADYEAQQLREAHASMACTLAGLLKDNEPCPVCGSRSHPQAAVPQQQTISLKEKIETQKKNLENNERILRSIEAGKIRLEAVAAQQEAVLGDGGQDGSTHLSVSEAQQLYERAKEIDLARETAYQKAAELYKKMSASTASYKAAALKLSDAEKAEAAAQAAARELGKSTGDCKTDEITEKYEALKKNLEKNRTLIAVYRQEKQRSEQNLAATEATRNSLQKAAEESKINDGQARTALEEALSSTPFSSGEQARSALLSADLISRCQSETAHWKSDLEKTTALLEEQEETTSADKLKQLLSETAEKHAAVKQELDEVHNLLNTKKITRAGIRDRIKRREELESRRLTLQQKSKAAVTLSEDLNGINPKKTPFDAWVLGMYFEEVVEYANPRFSRISAGRYQFKINTAAAGGNSYRGLDLLVSDSYTGHDRDTATLSGGETFMASISLALALTDVVQNKSGGIRLDSLFIDEGFGSLDGDALDNAITILRTIQEQRVVGVVSHVESMQSAIHSQLLVSKSVSGSHISIR